MTYPQRRLATANPSGRRLPRQDTALHILQRSIDDQIEALILQHPDCTKAASRRVDRLLLTAEAFGGHR